ncbi:MAG: hypothetical protein F4X59_18150 [Holophagales bacterium]|nr:hypothetical protein [Holophagales bacterium]MYC12029.1 hypothetical protein [Holophagales bacterium]
MTWYSKLGYALIPVAVAKIGKPVFEQVGAVLAERIKRTRGRPTNKKRNLAARETKQVFDAVLRSDSRRIDLREFCQQTTLAWKEYGFDHGLPGCETRKAVVVMRLAQTLARISGAPTA